VSIQERKYMTTKYINQTYFDSRSNEELEAERVELMSDTKTYWSAEEVKRDFRRAQEIKAELDRRNKDV
jgi:hypothetical protein